MGPPQRIRYNSKARSSHKKKKGRKTQRDVPAAEDPAADPNAPILHPKTKDEKEDDRRERLKQELLGATESKMTSKKRKRMESYIDKKLKKEERLLLFDRLAQTQTEVDAMNLKTSATLGSAKVVTHAQRLEKDEDKEVRKVAEGRARGNNKRRRTGPSPYTAEDSEDEEMVENINHLREVEDTVDLNQFEEEGPSVHERSFQTPAATPKATIEAGPLALGSALRRNADGTVERPRVVRPKARPRQAKRVLRNLSLENENSREVDSDNSFDSSDSDLDTGASHTDSASSHQGSWDGCTLEEGQRQASSSEDSEGSGDEISPSHKSKTGGFKEWAQKQIAVMKGHDAPPTMALAELPYQHVRPANPPPRNGVKAGPLGEALVLPNTSFAQHLQSSRGGEAAKPWTKRVAINRTDHVRESRILLPILAEEQSIVEAILLNPVVVICGETGSGKTTQVPQFLFEAGFGSPDSDNPGMIGITQPRRVAATSMASRVAEELSLPLSRVSYQIRYDATVSPSTSIKFMTDGVLLRELVTDFLLSKYSVIIVDEAHERSMNTDILIGVLSRVMRLREEMWKQNKDGAKPLRLVIMSATLRVDDFAGNKTLFTHPPPIITVEARQHPVTVHFSRRTPSDYIHEAVKKAIKIHTRLPQGGIIIFLTGQNEIQGVCKRLEKRFGSRALQRRRLDPDAPPPEDGAITQESKIVDAHGSFTKGSAREGVVEAEDIDLGEAPDVDDHAEEDLRQREDSKGLDTDTDDDDEAQIDMDDSDVPMHIVPLYSLLSSEKQMEVFQPPPLGSRLVVVATNVAETSLTIPGIRYVIDTGKAKQRLHDTQSGVESFQVAWISKASAAQRSGRAGRTGPGHCYRLYSSAFYENHLQAFTEPEILRVPIEGLVLQMKSMHIDAVVNFPFPTPPNRDALLKAEVVLNQLGALDPSPTSTKLAKSTSRSNNLESIGGRINDLGRAMALFPLSPRFSKMIITGRQHGCLPHVVALVAAMSVGDPFVRAESLGEHSEVESGGEEQQEIRDSILNHIRSLEIRQKEERNAKRRAFFKSQELHSTLGNHSSDAFRILSVVGAFEYAGGGHEFCAEHFVRLKAMEEIHKLRTQISRIIEANFSGSNDMLARTLEPPTPAQLKVLRQLLTSGFIDHVAVRKDVAEKATSSGTKLASCRGVAYCALNLAEDTFIHPSSVLFHQSPPDWIVYQEVVRSGRVWLKNVTLINPAWLSNLGKVMCIFSKPHDLPASAKKAGSQVRIVTPHFGPHRWELPPMKV